VRYDDTKADLVHDEEYEAVLFPLGERVDMARLVQVDYDDRDLRTEVHTLLLELGITAVFVTHDQAEAFVLGDRVAVMKDGEIVQRGTPRSLYERPATRWIADFVGDSMLLECTASGTTAQSPFGPIALSDTHHGRVDVVLRPEQLELTAGSIARVELSEYYGHDIVHLVELDGGQRLRVRSSPDSVPERNTMVGLAFRGEPTMAFKV
jgi:iron(III) transport system ATP-binding protein